MDKHWILAALLVAMVCTGCGPQRATVSGNVTLNGQPLDKGVIYFNSQDLVSKENISADIVNGQYSAEVVVGPKQIQFLAPIVTGTRPEYVGPGAPLVEITEERLPAKYNSASDLTFDVKAGKNEKDWALEAPPLPKR